MKRVGVVAVQGAFARHVEVVRALGHEGSLVRRVEDLAGIDALVFPGGESTVQLDLLGRLGLEAPLRRLVASGIPTFATCAGLILLARRVVMPEQRSWGLLGVEAARNAWGRQVDSFEARSDRGRPLVFIRAPRIRSVDQDTDVLDTLDGEPLLVRTRNVTAATFHPELANDPELHREALGLGGATFAPLGDISGTPERSGFPMPPNSDNVSDHVRSES